MLCCSFIYYTRAANLNCINEGLGLCCAVGLGEAAYDLGVFYQEGRYVGKDEEMAK